MRPGAFIEEARMAFDELRWEPPEVTPELAIPIERAMQSGRCWGGFGF